jgi:hypothetical protein
MRFSNALRAGTEEFAQGKGDDQYLGVLHAQTGDGLGDGCDLGDATEAGAVGGLDDLHRDRRVGLDQCRDPTGIGISIIDRLADPYRDVRQAGQQQTVGIEVFVDLQGQPVFGIHLAVTVVLFDLVGLERQARGLLEAAGGLRDQGVVDLQVADIGLRDHAVMAWPQPCQWGLRRCIGVVDDLDAAIFGDQATAAFEQVQRRILGRADLQQHPALAVFVHVKLVAQGMEFVLGQIAQGTQMP